MANAAIPTHKAELPGETAEISHEPSEGEKPVDPFESDLRKCDFEFEEVMKIKINARGTTLQDLKKRMDDQKILIVKLREGLISILVFIFRNYWRSLRMHRCSKSCDQQRKLHTKGPNPEFLPKRSRANPGVAEP